MRSAGFGPSTHRVWSWYMTHDTAFLSRALRGLNALIDQTPVDDLAIYDQGQLVFQPYNLAAMIKASSTLTKVSCGWTYRSLFGHTLNFHDPEQDTLANVRIYNEVLKQTRPWLEEDKENKTDN